MSDSPAANGTPSNIESASAGTACQTTKSYFAYILTGAVLGAVAALAIAVTLLGFAVLGTMATYHGAYTSNDYGYGQDDGTGAQGQDDGDSWGDEGIWGNQDSDPSWS